MLTRRDFIKVLGAISAAVMNPFNKILRWGALEIAVAEEIPGELYAGFVLLKEGEPIPEFVQDEKFGYPNVCGVSDGEHEGKATAKSEDFKSIADLPSEIDLQLYTLNNLLDGLKPSGASILSTGTGELYNVTSTFEAFDNSTGIWYTAVSIEAKVDFPRPIPLWLSPNLEDGVPPLILTKEEFFIGIPGIVISTPTGYLLHWINDGAYYILSLEHFPTLNAQSLISMLSPVN